MIQKESHKLNSAAVKIGEIHQETANNDRYFFVGRPKITNWLTRSQQTRNYDKDSSWQNEPDL